MEDITQKASAVLKDPMFLHAVGFGGVAFGITKYLEQGKPLPPSPQVVQIASKPRNTKLLVTLGVIGASYWYMSVYNHSFFGHSLTSSSTSK
jgi:hypothetical protein